MRSLHLLRTSTTTALPLLLWAWLLLLLASFSVAGGADVGLNDTFLDVSLHAERNRHWPSWFSTFQAPESIPTDPTWTSGATDKVVDNQHTYYVSRLYGSGDRRAREMWVGLDGTVDGSPGGVRAHESLSGGYRQAVNVNLSFAFPYYGHDLHSVTLATGGFIFVGVVKYRMITLTQYIAPLMANFAPSLSDNSTVKYYDNGGGTNSGTKSCGQNQDKDPLCSHNGLLGGWGFFFFAGSLLAVEWSDVCLFDNRSVGGFTFQAVLHSDGRIIFGYKTIPIPISQISSGKHPVKVGISDAFILTHRSPGKPIPSRWTVYEYHRVDLDTTELTSGCTIELVPLPTCNQYKTCDSCLSAHIAFDCGWCGSIQRCSSGFDRHRQEWIDGSCRQEASTESCPADELASRGSEDQKPPLAARPTSSDRSSVRGATSMSSVLLAASLSLAVLLLLAACGLALYVHRYPTSSVSLFLIEFRPKMWPTVFSRRVSEQLNCAAVETIGHDKEVLTDTEKSNQTYEMMPSNA
ncbi:plexin domain-containing protein 1-like isoform X1 [Petromyzon marinus]|uniref:plexin domain-containing protein 1-like isoform X1 n=1 Tax=Petromyzon marinus TaxID=7757 RepID=UPI003F71878A